MGKSHFSRHRVIRGPAVLVKCRRGWPLSITACIRMRGGEFGPAQLSSSRVKVVGMGRPKWMEINLSDIPFLTTRWRGKMTCAQLCYFHFWKQNCCRLFNTKVGPKSRHVFDFGPSGDRPIRCLPVRPANSSTNKVAPRPTKCTTDPSGGSPTEQMFEWPIRWLPVRLNVRLTN